jgi:hypothetical protein
MSSEVAVITPEVVRTPCKLTIEPLAMHAVLGPPVHWLCGSKTTVEELTAAVRLPRKLDSTVMLLEEIAVTAPVKSSMFAKSPLGMPDGTVLDAVITPDCVTSIPMPLVVTIALL